MNIQDSTKNLTPEALEAFDAGTVANQQIAAPVAAPEGSTNKSVALDIVRQEAITVWDKYVIGLDQFARNISPSESIKGKHITSIVRKYNRGGFKVIPDMVSRKAGETMQDTVNTNYEDITVGTELKYFAKSIPISMYEDEVTISANEDQLVQDLFELVSEEFAQVYYGLFTSANYATSVNIGKLSAFTKESLVDAISKAKKLGSKNPYIALDSNFYVKAASKETFIVTGSNGQVTTGVLGGYLGATFDETNCLPENGEKLAGVMVTNKNCLLYANRLPKIDGFKEPYDIKVVNIGGIYWRIFKWKTFNQRETFITAETLVGFSPVLTDKLIRLVYTAE